MSSFHFTGPGKIYIFFFLPMPTVLITFVLNSTFSFFLFKECYGIIGILFIITSSLSFGDGVWY